MITVFFSNQNVILFNQDLYFVKIINTFNPVIYLLVFFNQGPNNLIFLNVSN